MLGGGATLVHQLVTAEFRPHTENWIKWKSVCSFLFYTVTYLQNDLKIQKKETTTAENTNQTKNTQKTWLLFQELCCCFSLRISRKPEESFAFSTCQKEVIFVLCHPGVTFPSRRKAALCLCPFSTCVFSNWRVVLVVLLLDKWERGQITPWWRWWLAQARICFSTHFAARAALGQGGSGSAAFLRGKSVPAPPWALWVSVQTSTFLLLAGVTAAARCFGISASEEELKKKNWSTRGST